MNTELLNELVLSDKNLYLTPDLDKNLTFVSLSHNHLITVPDISNCKKLKEINLYGNDFTLLSHIIISTLYNLRCNGMHNSNDYLKIGYFSLKCPFKGEYAANFSFTKISDDKLKEIIGLHLEEVFNNIKEHIFIDINEIEEGMEFVNAYAAFQTIPEMMKLPEAIRDSILYDYIGVNAPVYTGQQYFYQHMEEESQKVINMLNYISNLDQDNKNMYDNVIENFKKSYNDILNRIPEYFKAYEKKLVEKGLGSKLKETKFNFLFEGYKNKTRKRKFDNIEGDNSANNHEFTKQKRRKVEF